MKRLFFVCLMIVGISSFTYSQAKRQDIIKLLDVSNVRSQAAQMFNLMLPNLKSMAPGAPSTFWTRLESRLDMDGFVDLFIPIYDRNFSHDDIKNLIKFYESPIGKKMLEVTPSMTQESYRVGEEWGQKLAMDIISELKRQGYY